MPTGDHWAPLPLPGIGLRRVHALIDLCRCLSAQFRGEPVPVPHDWAAVVATAEYNRLTPALWETIRLDDNLDERLATRLQGAYAANVVARGRLAEQLRSCLDTFNRRGISPLVLKGAVTLLNGVSVSAARVMTDLDLLVPDHEFEGACAALRQVGYVVFPAPGRAGQFEWAARRPDLAAPIDLHRALGVGVVAQALPVAAISQRSSRCDADGLSYRVLDPADQLAHAVVHSQCNDNAHRTGAIAPRQLHNFAALYYHVDDPGAWPAAVRRLDHPRLRRVVRGHAALQRYLFGIDLSVPEPDAISSLHLARCLATYAVPHASDVETNLLLAFAAPTMKDRYPDRSVASARMHHIMALLQDGVGSVKQEALRSRNG